MKTAWIQHPTRKELRDFGLTVGAVLVIIGGFLYWRNPDRSLPYWFAGIGTVLAAFGLLVPGALKVVYQLWMAMAFHLGRVMTAVILSVFYFIAFGIIAVILKIVGKDPMDRKWTPGAKTYWRDREVLAKEGRDLKPY